MPQPVSSSIVSFVLSPIQVDVDLVQLPVAPPTSAELSSLGLDLLSDTAAATQSTYPVLLQYDLIFPDSPINYDREPSSPFLDNLD